MEFVNWLGIERIYVSEHHSTASQCLLKFTKIRAPKCDGKHQVTTLSIVIIKFCVRLRN